MAESAKQRPKYLTLTEIRLPIAGFVSILHRVSGAGLFLLLPWLVFLFDLSLKSPESFARFQGYVAHPFVKLVLFGLIWAFLHHFCAGIRFLLLDVHVGIDKRQSQASAKAVLAVSLALSLIVAVKLLGVF
jgi:succinate dehydrogenase / fumarate reductase, cytochrome b subunit